MQQLSKGEIISWSISTFLALLVIALSIYGALRIATIKLDKQSIEQIADKIKEKNGSKQGSSF